MKKEEQFNPFSPDALDDPFPFYKNLREDCPVHKYEDFTYPLYTTTRYEDVSEMLTNVELWSSHFGQMPRYSVQGCLFSDPPEHTWYRKLIQKSFAPRHVAAMEGEIEQLVKELVDEMAEKSQGDLHDALACPLPVIVIAKILGIPTKDIDQFKAWSDAQLAASKSSDDGRKGPREAMNAYLLEHLNIRRTLITDAGFSETDNTENLIGDIIPDDVISGILLAEVDNRILSDTERLVMLNQLLVGGNETTTSLLTNLFWRLLSDRSLYEQVRDDPSLHQVAVEESLRFDAPVLGLYRTNTVDIELYGEEIPERSKVMATFAAANRDPTIFTDPESFRLDRNPEELRKHLSFGLGRHFCPGAQLSRLEARLALKEVTERFPNLRLISEPERIEPFLLWGRKNLPVAWD
ncbi:MAG: cytochrome [Acidimicrobiaceae bacterium]|nr:cytochrome [Acidimicrobiaceae bacterium]MBA4810025.1 cytochrome P450 [Acidimicrobiales bacterium]MBC83854.1 cytochrome [Acidimicrobiaceae bacterium]|tara:strand:- start:90941 stop:92161 length:1221 start_codon:yes stop_codon:yes gene_type:complete